MMNLLVLAFIAVWTSVNARLNDSDYVERNISRQLLSYDAMEEEGGIDGDVIGAMNQVNKLFYETFKGQKMGTISKKFEAWKKRTYGEGLHKRHEGKLWFAENLLDLGVNFAVGGNIIGAAYETVAANTLAEYMGAVPEPKKVTMKWKHSGLAMFAEKVLKDAFKGAATGATAGAITGALTGIAAGVVFPPAIALFPATAAGGAALGALVGVTWGTIKGTVKGIYMLYRNRIKKKKFKEMAWSDYAEEAEFFHFDELPFHYQQKLLFTLDTIAEQTRIKTSMWSNRNIKEEMANSMRFIDAYDEAVEDKKRKPFDPKEPVLPILKAMFPKDTHPKIKNEFHKLKKLWDQHHQQKPKQQTKGVSTKQVNPGSMNVMQFPVLQEKMKSDKQKQKQKLKSSVSTKTINMGYRDIMQLPKLQELLKSKVIWQRVPPEIKKTLQISSVKKAMQKLPDGVAVFMKVNPNGEFEKNVEKVLLSPPQKPLPPNPLPKKKQTESKSPQPPQSQKSEHKARDQYFDEYNGYIEDDFDRYYKKQNMYTYQPYDVNDVQFNNLLVIGVAIIICGVGIMICLGSICIASLSAVACYVWQKKEEKLNETENDMPHIYVEE